MSKHPCPNIRYLADLALRLAAGRADRHSIARILSSWPLDYRSPLQA